ncbi:hypothetical protein N431DRAFT_459612 [Stipitochalara longipes BDJ]|nr:hypothetical protein N431DRAFT_459612 [Stipitochalara longipes BDJ]
MFKKEKSKEPPRKGSGNQSQSQAGPSDSGQPQSSTPPPDPPQLSQSYPSRPHPASSGQGTSGSIAAHPTSTHLDPAHSGETHLGQPHPHSLRPGSSHTGSSLSKSFHTPEERLQDTEAAPKRDPYKYQIEKWPKRSKPHENGKIYSHRYVGPYDENPDERISQDPLDWRVVSKMPKEERKRHIIARANFFTQTIPTLLRVPAQVFVEGWIKYASLGERGGSFSTNKPLHPLQVDRKQLWNIDPAYGLIATNESLENNRMHALSTLDQMKETMKLFNIDPVSHQLLLLLTRNLSRQMPCKKIVAFGAWAMSLAHPELSVPIDDRKLTFYPSDAPMRMQVQHAAIFAVRNILEIFYNRKIPLYLQDMNYVEVDKKAAQGLQNPAIIVNGDFGFQQGWVEIDESTLFFDCSFLTDGFYHHIFEYTRPAAILSLVTYYPDFKNDFRKAQWSYTYPVDDVHGFWDLHYPGLGIKDYSAGIVKVLDYEYDRLIMDENTQQRFIGMPTLYIRKSNESMPPGSSESAR